MLDICIDVSHHNGVIDWAAVAESGIKLAIIKATQGVSYVDPRFGINVANARSAGLYVIPYHFLDKSDPDSQARHFAGVAQLGLGTPFALDWESNDAPPAVEVEEIGNILAEITGRTPLGYWGIRGSTPRNEPPTDEMRSWHRWIPRYRAGSIPDFGSLPSKLAVWPGETCLLWQYTDGGQVPGIKGNVDRNVWFGSLSDLHSYCAAPVAIAPPEPAIPALLPESPPQPLPPAPKPIPTPPVVVPFPPPARPSGVLAWLSRVLGFGCLLLTLSAGVACAETLPVVPDDTLTPGVVASTDPAEVCGRVDGLTYSQRHRQTTDKMKQAVYAAYHINRAGRDFEVDHREPICAGGADVLKNLWIQLGFLHPSYHDKDRLEAYVCRAVCRTHTMTLAEGQAIFLGDWTVGFERVFGRRPD